MIGKLPPRWDVEADVVAVGSGAGGLGAAITAHDHGASAIVLERAEQFGGVTALSMGELWIPGNHLAAAQGIDFHRPLTTAPHLERVHAQLRQVVPFFDADRYFAPDIAAAKAMVLRGDLSASCRALFTPLHP